MIFVHGCYWHMHECPLGVVRPKTNEEFWQQKRMGIVKRDKRNLHKLRKESSLFGDSKSQLCKRLMAVATCSLSGVRLLAGWACRSLLISA